MAKNPHLKGILDDMVRIQQSQFGVLGTIMKCEAAILDCRNALAICSMVSMLAGVMKKIGQDAQKELEELKKAKKDAEKHLRKYTKELTQLGVAFQTNQRALDTIRENINSPLTIF